MKSYFFTALCVFICINASAQIARGTKFAGLALNFNGANTNNQNTDYSYKQKNWGIGLNPEYAAFLKDNFALGIGLNFSYGGSKSESSNLDSQSSSRSINTNYSIRPFIRNYKMLGQKFGIFLHSSFSASIGKQKTKNSNEEGNSENQYNTLGLGLSVGPGIVYFISEKWVVEATTGSAGFYYTSSKSISPSSTYKNTNFGADFNVGLNSWGLGLKYYFQ
jgi:hypothetical protein